jgi:NAD(P)-dependent dehydrogenase (short-subunit alcohol dehydrogenase family)
MCAPQKVGVDQIALVLAFEWGGDGIRVNLILPGPIAGTEGAKRLSLPGSEAPAIESIALKRMGTKDDIAWLVMFLASLFATYTSGASLRQRRRARKRQAVDKGSGRRPGTGQTGKSGLRRLLRTVPQRTPVN